MAIAMHYVVSRVMLSYAALPLLKGTVYSDGVYHSSCHLSFVMSFISVHFVEV